MRAKMSVVVEISVTVLDPSRLLLWSCCDVAPSVRYGSLGRL
jgi:hypothetical protein